jgi:hypothetical protein
MIQETGAQAWQIPTTVEFLTLTARSIYKAREHSVQALTASKILGYSLQSAVVRVTLLVRQPFFTGTRAP